jgi:hypothetical protein
MPILLDSYRTKLESRLKYLSLALARTQQAKFSARKADAFAAQEGLVSTLWQAWGAFSKSAILGSAAGGITSSGSITTSPFTSLPLGELREVARCYAKGINIVSGRAIRGDYLEPTWGDVTNATKIVNGFGLSNSSAILTGLGVLTLARDVKTVRNAAAHLSPDRINDIKLMQLRYARTAFKHPTDALFWIEPSSGNVAWMVWIDEMRSAAKLVVA